MLKKSLLALAVAGLSANAFAADVDYTATTAQTVNTIAKEVVPVTTATDLTTTDKITFPLGFSATNQNLVRIDLSNGAQFTADPGLVVDGGAGTAGAPLGGLDASISEGGIGKSYVVFQLKGPNTVAQNKPVVLVLAGLTVANQGDVNAQYRLYDNQVDAHNATSRTLADKSYAYATFANALTFVAANPGVSKQIDVGSGSKKFKYGTTVSGDSAFFGGLNLKVADNTYGSTISNLSTDLLTLSSFIGPDAKLTVTGDFSAATDVNLGSSTSSIPGVINTAKNAATFDLTSVISAGGWGTDAAQLQYLADQKTVIAPSEFGAKLTLGTNASLISAPAAVSNFATLAKNGATEYVDLALKPGGAFSDYVRITNRSSTDGNVFLTVINDNGDKASIGLSDIEGQTSNVLAGNASTSQITIQSIFDAAAAKGLTLTGEQKLRLVVDAEVTDLSVQSYTISTDGTTFSTFK